MTHLSPSLARRLHPLRYWLFVAYAVGVPNFIKFDNTGLTHKAGLFNASSISSILLMLTCSFLFITMTLLTRHRILLRKIDVAAWVWLLLLIDFTIASLLQPKSALTPFKATDLPLSLYRLAEWILAFVMLISLYSREAVESATDLIIRLIATLCWTNIAFVWITLPFMPSLVYGAADDTGEANRRLGGTMIHPVHLSVLAGAAFFHALIFMRGPKRIAACIFAFATLVLTYARSELIIFMIVLAVYALVLSRSALLRWAGLLTPVFALALAVTFQERVLKYLARGQGTRNITTLSERTLVWKASFEAIATRPYIGYGYVAGAKNALKDHWNSTNWLPPHSHSEFIQAVLSGGYLAGALVVVIYGRVLWSAVRQAIHGSVKQMFLLIVLIQVTLMAIIMPLITVPYAKVSGLFLMTFVGIVAGERRRVAVKARRAATIENVPAFGWAKQQS